MLTYKNDDESQTESEVDEEEAELINLLKKTSTR
jgi:hypothetical protein